MIEIQFTHDQIMALLYAIRITESERVGDFEHYAVPLVGARLTLENASLFQDHIIFPDGHRLPDERDKS